MATNDEAFPPLPRTKLVQRKPEPAKASPASPCGPAGASPAVPEQGQAPAETLGAAPGGAPGGEWRIDPSGPDTDSPPELDGMVMLALKSPKERNFLLKLESHIINNLQNSAIERIKLTTPMPPKLRKLVHMVSDYFGLSRIVDKEEGEEKKATMTLVKIENTRIPVRTLAVICTELDDEDRQPFQLQRKVAEATGATGDAVQAPEEPRPAPSWAEVAAAKAAPEPVPLAAGPLPGNVALRRPLPPVVQRQEGAEGEGPASEGNEADSSPLEVSPSDQREEDDATLSDDEAEDEQSDEGLVSRPPPAATFVPGKIKVMQRQQADGEEIPKSSGDESEPSKIDPSRLPLEERERYYMEARARIFGGAKVETEAPAEEAAAPEDPQTVQRRAALEMKLAQERMNDLKDPAYSRAIYPRFGYAMKGKGKGQLQGFIAGFQAAPTDYQGADPSQAPIAARAAVLEGQAAPSWRQQQPQPQQSQQQQQPQPQQSQQQQQPQPQTQQPQQQQQQQQQQAMLQQAMLQQAMQQQQALQQQVLQQQQAMQAAQAQQQTIQQQAMQAMQQQAMQQAMQQLLMQQQSMQQQAMQQQAMMPQMPDAMRQEPHPGDQRTGRPQPQLAMPQLQVVGAIYPQVQNEDGTTDADRLHLAL